MMSAPPKPDKPEVGRGFDSMHDRAGSFCCGAAMPLQERLDTCPRLGRVHIHHAMMNTKAAVVLTGFVGTRPPRNPFRRRMQRCPTLRQMRTKQCESGHVAQGGQMTRAGVVANENPG